MSDQERIELLQSQVAQLQEQVERLMSLQLRPPIIPQPYNWIKVIKDA